MGTKAVQATRELPELRTVKRCAAQWHCLNDFGKSYIKNTLTIKQVRICLRAFGDVREEAQGEPGRRFCGAPEKGMKTIETLIRLRDDCED